MRGWVHVGFAIALSALVWPNGQSAALAKLPPPQLGKRPSELSMLSKWSFQDVKVYSRASSEPPDFESGTVERYYEFLFFLDADPQKIAHEFKASLTKGRGWSIAFPSVGIYEFMATHERPDGKKDLFLSSITTGLGLHRTFLFVRDETRPIFKGRFGKGENPIIYLVASKNRPKGW